MQPPALGRGASYVGPDGPAPSPRAQRGAALGGAGAADHAARPPRWEYTAVQKSFCLYYEATGSVAQLSKAQREEIAGGASPVNYEGKARDEPAGSRAPSVAPTPRSVVGDATADSSPAPPGGALRRESRINLEPSLSAVGLGDGLGTGGDDKGAPKTRRGLSRLRSSGTAVAAASRANSAIADADEKPPPVESVRSFDKCNFAPVSYTHLTLPTNREV